MSIIASAPVPPASRLIDAPTLDRFPVINRTYAPAGIDCPAWCNHGHAGEVTEIDGFSLGTLHERILTELTALDPATTDKPATALVLIDQCDEPGVPSEPARVVLTVTPGVEAQYPGGGVGVQGWTGTPEQAEELAGALMTAAAFARASRVRRGGAR